MSMGQRSRLADFWLDSSVLIEAHARYYAMDIAPPFWAFLDAQAAAGRVQAPLQTFQELVDYGYRLSDWVMARNATVFVEPDQQVQQSLTQIADYVIATYEPYRARQFLNGADPWLIAHAKAHGGKVVTKEIQAGPGGLTPKIPNVCAEFDVPLVRTWDMLRPLGFRF